MINHHNSFTVANTNHHGPSSRESWATSQQNLAQNRPLGLVVPRGLGEDSLDVTGGPVHHRTRHSMRHRCHWWSSLDIRELSIALDDERLHILSEQIEGEIVTVELVSEELSSEDIYVAKIMTEVKKTQQKAKSSLFFNKMHDEDKAFRETHTVLRQKGNQQVMSVNPSANMLSAALTRLKAITASGYRRLGHDVLFFVDHHWNTITSGHDYQPSFIVNHHVLLFAFLTTIISILNINYYSHHR